MQRAPEVPQILADLMLLSERELILKAAQAVFDRGRNVPGQMIAAVNVVVGRDG